MPEDAPARVAVSGRVVSVRRDWVTSVRRRSASGSVGLLRDALLRLLNQNRCPEFSIAYNSESRSGFEPVGTSGFLRERWFGTR